MVKNTNIDLDKKFIPLVRTGVKTQTVRQGKRDHYLLGETLLITDKVNLKIYINEIHYKAFNKLTEQDAILDGFSSLEELRGVLLGFYPDTKEEDTVTVVKFDYIGIA